MQLHGSKVSSLVPTEKPAPSAPLSIRDNQCTMKNNSDLQERLDMLITRSQDSFCTLEITQVTSVTFYFNARKVGFTEGPETKGSCLCPPLSLLISLPSCFVVSLCTLFTFSLLASGVCIFLQPDSSKVHRVQGPRWLSFYLMGYLTYISPDKRCYFLFSGSHNSQERMALSVSFLKSQRVGRVTGRRVDET